MSDCFHKWCMVTAALLTAGVIFFIAGFSSESWAVSEYERSGLWNECETIGDYERCDSLTLSRPEYMVWSRVLGILVIFILMAAIGHYACTSCCVNCVRKCLLIFHMVVLFGAAATMVVMLFIYVDHYNATEATEMFTLGYSFYLVCIAALFCAVAGMFAMVDLFTHESRSYEVPHTRLEK